MASTHLLLIIRTCSSSSCTTTSAAMWSTTRLSRTTCRSLTALSTLRSKILAPAATTTATAGLRSSKVQQQQQQSQQLSQQSRPQQEQRRHYTPPKPHFYQNRILDPYVNQTVTPITLRQLVFFGRNMQEDKLLKSANYVRTELPVRLAHRIRDFQNLPFIVGTNPHIEQVYDLYWQAFDKLRQVPEIKTLEANDQFCELVKGLLNDHLVVIPQLALGIMESSKHIERNVVDQFMNKMLRSRISRRVLAEQHISLTANYNSPNHMMTDRGYIGIIYTHCNPREIVERTAHLAAETCRRQQQDFVQSCRAAAKAAGGSEGDEGEALAKEPPKVILDGSIDAEFAYIPDHIEYILYELLKNSMRFVMLNGKADPITGELPPIQITVCEGKEDITFRVSDRGGGIPPAMESHLWSYSQSPITARFANFEKISKMAATVQEQMVSPSRSINAAENDYGDVQTGPGPVRAGGPIANSIMATEVIRNEDILEDELLPPPPPNYKPIVGSDDEAHLRLDRHAEDRMRSQNLSLKARAATSESKSATSTSNSTPDFTTTPAQPTSSCASSTSPPSTVIDTGKTAAPSKKRGHLDRATREAAERQHDQSMHLGIGLPMSRVYAEYWGGDLKVYTMHGYGTDAYARFCKFGNIYENFDV